MGKSLIDTFSYTHGASSIKGSLLVASVSDDFAEDKVDHGFVFGFMKDDWIRPIENNELEWSVVGVTVVKEPMRQGLLLGMWGEVLCIGSGDTHTEVITPVKKRGPLLSTFTVGGRAYAVGMGRQVYRRDGRDQWTAIDEQIRPAKDDAKPYGFDTIAGFSESDIYAAGRYGEVFHFDGKTWTRLPVPTDQIITHACCAGDGKVYLCGRNGLLLKGRGAEWKVIDHGKRDDCWNLCWFDGRLYVATMKDVFWLSEEADGDYLNDVDWTNGDKPATCLRLSVADGVMWSIGAKDVLSFDGTTWTRIDGKPA